MINPTQTRQRVIGPITAAGSPGIYWYRRNLGQYRDRATRSHFVAIWYGEGARSHLATVMSDAYLTALLESISHRHTIVICIPLEDLEPIAWEYVP